MVSIDNKSRVRELFTYSDGVMYWKAKSSKYSRAKIGGAAGSKDKDGYIIIRVRNETRGAQAVNDERDRLGLFTKRHGA